MRPLRLAAALVLATVLLFSAPAGALAQLSPFSQGTPAPTQATPTVTTASTSSSSDSGLSTTSEVLIGAVGILLITGIVGLIYFDSRRRAPVKEGETGYEEPVSKGQHRKKTQQRARAKRAKAARRRNR